MSRSAYTGRPNRARQAAPTPPTVPSVPARRRGAPASPDPHRGLRAAGIAAACVLVALVVAYVAGCVYFSNRLWPNTSADGIDLSLMTREQALAALDDASSELNVHVSGQGVDFELTSANSGIALDAETAVDEMLADAYAWQWPMQLLAAHDESAALSTSFDHEQVLAAVEQALAPFNETASDPVDAWVGYDEASGSFVVNPGSIGTKLDAATVAASVEEALAAEQATVALTEAHLVQQSVTADEPALQQAAAAANAYLACSLDLTLDGTVVAHLDGSTVKDWVVVAGDWSVSIDDGQLAAWVDGVEAAVDNVGGTRTYTRPDGKTATVTGGTYGWISNGDEIEALVRDAVAAGTVGSQEIPCRQYAAQYNPGGQDWGARYLDVDLSEQHVRLYDSDGSLVWESDCISGSPLEGNDTPTGVYVLNNKATDQTLVGATDPATGEPEYETPVSYWMPFIGNSIGLHDATWQTNGFGGTLYQEGYGSHGCINLPYDAAEGLYSLLQVGDVVVVHN